MAITQAAQCTAECAICDAVMQRNDELEDEKAALGDQLERAESDIHRLRRAIERAKACAAGTLPVDDGLKLLTVLRSVDE
ncbi:hypothetical protein [Kushneria aurantia]|uniref:Uncharacterized protein n=1 Tax=Kushneria aurantia TaxID=504092 RepID=A0ABV6G536_9GAMM|nr:hypothetical protein [Kushneria aurantia]